jgi:hypothetical protein
MQKSGPSSTTVLKSTLSRQEGRRITAAWSLQDLRRFLVGPARFRWIRAIRARHLPDLTNFGDLQ